MIGFEPGALFEGRYEIVKHLGAGGMGAVYLACDPRHRDFLVALKVLYPGVIKSEEARLRFRNEIVASYRVNHRNIVRAYEYFDEPEFQAYAMEYVDGGDLLDRISQGSISIPEVIEILRQATSGLEAVHAEGICHRDLKPENILLTKKGVVKITDFGVARLKGGQGLTQVGAMVGTPKYLAPEYVETGESDHRGDLYALGVIAYEMLTGVSPFRAESKTALMIERFQNEFAPILSLRPDCPVALAKIIEKAMSVKLSERYQSAEEMRLDLELLAEAAPATLAIEKPKVYFEIPRKIEKHSPIQMALGEGPPRAGVNQFSFKKLLSIVLFLSLGIGMAVGTWAYVGSQKRMAFTDLPLGIYSGQVVGLFADGQSEPISIWHTKAGVFALLGRPRCEVTPVSPQGRFFCGELGFELHLQSVERGTAIGVIKELGWNLTATWSVTEEGSR
jgi:serine/threonine protein kinase